MLAGKSYLITGAGSGIGRAAASVFAREGASLALADINDDNRAEVLAEVAAFGTDVVFSALDVADRGQVAAWMQESIDRFGRIHGSFNNAGISGPSAVSHKWEPEAFARVVTVNIIGVWNCMMTLMPHLLDNGGGSIVNTASVSGVKATGGKAPYVASKHGVIGLTKDAALDYATSGVRINAVCPGPIRTPLMDKHIRSSADPAAAEAVANKIVPMGRMGTSEEVAEAAAWLCSDYASFITGVALPVDGGYLAG